MKWGSVSALFDAHRAAKTAYEGVLLPGAYIDLQGTLMSVDANSDDDFVPLSGGFPKYNRFINWFGHNATLYGMDNVHLISDGMGNYVGHLKELGYTHDKFGMHAKGDLRQKLVTERARLELLVDDRPGHDAVTTVHPRELARLLKAAGITP